MMEKGITLKSEEMLSSSSFITCRYLITDISFSFFALGQLVIDREARCAEVHGVTKSRIPV